ncbi:MAG: MFS transporter [Chloroflexi bacterium]|nr:MFS transporter [Chloroflexota bacterium]
MLRTLVAERRPGPTVGLVALSCGVFLGALDQTVVATLLPSMIVDLEIPFGRLGDAAWIVTGYLLGYTIAMPLIGQLADRRGRVRVYVACLMLFVVASVACGAARSLEWLIVARMVQAIGGGALLPVALAVSDDRAGPGRRSVALGMVGAVAEAGGVLGPLYGAAFLQWGSWRWVFYLNVPIGLAIAAFALWSDDEQPVRPAGALDVSGGVLLGAALGLVTFGLSQEQTAERSPLAAGALVLAGVGLLAAFVAAERAAQSRGAAPLIDLGLFRRPPFAAANLVHVLVGMGLIVAMVDLPLWSATVLQRPPTEGGLLLLRLTMLIPVGAVVGGWGTRLLGARFVTVAGLLACAASFLLLSRWPATAHDGSMTWDLALGGLGFGLLLAPITTTAIAWAGPGRGAVAASLVTLMRMVGMTVGLSALTSYGLGRFNGLVRDLPLPLPLPGEAAEALALRQSEYTQEILGATVTVFHEIFLAAAVLSLAAIIPALLLRLPRQRSSGDR